MRNKAIYIALGVLPDGTKEILGIWIEQTEGAKFWLRVVNELKTRGAQDILIAVVDGLKGFPEAINAVFPQTVVPLPQPRSCRRLHGAQHIPQPAEINASFRANHRAGNLDANGLGPVRRRRGNTFVTGFPHDRYKHRHRVGRQRQQTGSRRLAPTKQMLR